MSEAADSNIQRSPLSRAFVGAFMQAQTARSRIAAQFAVAKLDVDEIAAFDAANESADGAEDVHADAHADIANVANALPASAQGGDIADLLATQLQAVTRKLARDAMAWTGAAGEADIAAAQFAFVALLDELLVFSDWPGASAWEAQPLEARIFGTRSAGERVPDAIETLLAQRDPGRRDLANVYLACLELGFKGKLRGETGAMRLDQLRHALFGFAMQRDPDPARIATPLDEAALPPREPRMLTQMFPDRARFVLLVLGGCAALLGASHAIWWYETAPVRVALAQFEAVSVADAQSMDSRASGAVAPGVAPPAGNNGNSGNSGNSGGAARGTASPVSPVSPGGNPAQPRNTVFSGAVMPLRVSVETPLATQALATDAGAQP
ncbi:type IV/VI secretion system ImpK/VasF family protein [Paraburkholderia bannensis]|uniref:Type IV/VI secretion system ImpK/VasF family protein n=1 Tax=Paraburkholderia bannensis TaxID=765414 RepID=A0A7W9WTJ1_9BURK|nr:MULTISPECIES: DotU family type IV/VI secretion system protein [Paraburkholderia]MBB3258379.1 type IV/VI secretion system ImpK/VasF family protein [Paraburkholderia sp. WP4_3_2]MBB6103392.1 type IV/VI secretion system ImpK/VasF family protein [Paraburkholderia bannensis]